MLTILNADSVINYVDQAGEIWIKKHILSEATSFTVAYPTYR